MLCTAAALAAQAYAAPQAETVASNLSGAAVVSSVVGKLPPLFDTLQERTFYFFWDNANPKTGLVPDRYPTPSFSSTAITRAMFDCF